MRDGIIEQTALTILRHFPPSAVSPATRSDRPCDTGATIRCGHFRRELVQAKEESAIIPWLTRFGERGAVAASRDSQCIRNVIVEKNVAMCACDGVTLRTDVYRPGASGKFPVLRVFTRS